MHHHVAARICPPENGHTSDAGQGLLEKLQSFPAELVGRGRHTCYIAAGPREAGHKPGFDGIGHPRHDNGYRCSNFFCRLSGGRIHGQDDVHPETDQLAGKGCEARAISPALRVSQTMFWPRT